MVYFVRTKNIPDDLADKRPNDLFVKMTLTRARNEVRNTYGGLVFEWEETLTEYFHLRKARNGLSFESKPDWQAIFWPYHKIHCCDLRSQVKMELSLVVCDSHSAKKPEDFADVYVVGRKQTFYIYEGYSMNSGGKVQKYKDTSSFLTEDGRKFPAGKGVPTDPKFEEVSADGSAPTEVPLWEPNPAHCGSDWIIIVPMKHSWKFIWINFARAFSAITRPYGRENPLDRKGAREGIPPGLLESEDDENPGVGGSKESEKKKGSSPPHGFESVMSTVGLCCTNSSPTGAPTAPPSATSHWTEFAALHYGTPSNTEASIAPFDGGLHRLSAGMLGLHEEYWSEADAGETHVGEMS